MKRISLIAGLFLICSLGFAQQIIRGIGPNGQPVPVAVDSNGNVIISNNGACNVGPGTPTCTPTFTAIPTTSPTPTNTPTITATPVQYWAKNGPGWLGPSPADGDANVADTAFNASGSAVQIATAVPTVVGGAQGKTDLYCTAYNAGTVQGNAILINGAKAVTYTLVPGQIVQHIYFQDDIGGSPVSLNGDSTAAVSIRFSNIKTRTR